MINDVVDNIDVWTTCSAKEILYAFTDGYTDGKFIYNQVEFFPDVKTVFEMDKIQEEDPPRFDSALVFYKNGVPVRIAFPAKNIYVPMALIRSFDGSKLDALLDKAGIRASHLIDIYEELKDTEHNKKYPIIESVCERGLLYAFLGASPVVMQGGDEQNKTVWQDMQYFPNFEMSMKVDLPSVGKDKKGVEVNVKHKGMLLGKRFDEERKEVVTRAIILQESAGIKQNEIVNLLEKIDSKTLDSENEYEKGLIGLQINQLTIEARDEVKSFKIKK